MMESKTKELVALGYRRADELKSCPEAWDPRSVAQLIIDLVAQLDVTAVVLREKSKQCDALAAECAGLKSFCKNAAFDADYDAELSMDTGGFTDALNDIETPTTDAFLREQMSKGVENFAGVAETMLVKFANSTCSHAPEAIAWNIVNKNAKRYAAKLRAGEAV